MAEKRQCPLLMQQNEAGCVSTTYLYLGLALKFVRGKARMNLVPFALGDLCSFGDVKLVLKYGV